MNLLYTEQFGKAFLPKKFRPLIREYSEKAGLEEVPYKIAGSIFWLGILFTIILYLAEIFPLLSKLGNIWFFLLTFLTFAIIPTTIMAIGFLITFVYLNLKVFHRTRKLEERLSDYLILVSTNIKGGMSFENSLWAAIKPEFGILAKEITIVSKKVMTGTDVTDALSEFSQKYDSPILRRNMNLIIGELESGGRIVHVIDKVIENLKKTKYLKQEMAASTVTYMIFIGSIVMAIAPGLFALSNQLLRIIGGFTGQLSEANTGAIGFPVSFSASVLPEDFQVFAVMALTIISVFSGMLISIIETGNIKGGIKYIFVFLVVSIVMFFLFSAMLNGVFSGFIPT